MLKQKLTLLGNIDNTFSFPQSTTDSFSITSEEKNIFNSTVTIFANRAKSHLTYDFVKKHIDSGFSKIDIVKIPKYALPVTFNTSTKKIIINISAMGKRSISNIEPRDLYTLVIYGHAFASLIINKVPSSLKDEISEFMSAIYLKTFAKKFGLIGSYSDLIPELRFLVSSYVNVSFFGDSPSDAFKTSARLSKYDLSNLQIDLKDYDFSKIYDLIKCLDKTGTLPGLNAYSFVSIMLRNFGSFNLPMFEDLSRFGSLLISSTINGNSIITPRLPYMNEDLSNRIIKGLTRYF